MIAPTPAQRRAFARAAKLIEKRESWTIGAEARTKTGAACAPKSPSAVAWCAWGALEKIESKAMVNAMLLLCWERLPGRSLTLTNDSPSGHARVLALFRELAGEERSEE